MPSPHKHPWPEFAKVVTISTAHMTNNDASYASDERWPCVAYGDSGYIFVVPSVEDYDWNNDDAFPYSAEVLNVLMFALEDGLDYVWFHRDGLYMPGFPTFDW